MIDLLFGSTIKKIAAGVIVFALLFGWFQIRGCMKAKEKLRLYEQAEKIRQQDKRTDEQTEAQKDAIDRYNTPDDFKSEFDRLRERSNRK